MLCCEPRDGDGKKEENRKRGRERGKRRERLTDGVPSWHLFIAPVELTTKRKRKCLASKSQDNDNDNDGSPQVPIANANANAGNWVVNRVC